MYSPHTEAEYLSYSTNLLLEKTSKSPDYNRFIYVTIAMFEKLTRFNRILNYFELLLKENPLSECQFREYNLSADWRRRHEIMTPMFVDTINSSLSDQSSFMFNDHSSIGNHGLRATQQQSLQFQATQDLVGNLITVNILCCLF